LNVYIHDWALIPLGFDYGCIFNRCKGSFNSLNSENSPDSTGALMVHFDRKHILNIIWRRWKHNTIAMGISRKGLMK
jgi:hypothetical protein